jgi:hypothetical protein
VYASTKVGRNRKRKSGVPTTPLTDHFLCESTKIQALMEREDFTFEQFARLPRKERDTCYEQSGDLHVRYLSKNRDIRVAKKRLLQMAFVGYAEDFSRSMQLLNWELNLELELYSPIFNKNAYSHQLSDRAIEALHDLNRMDIEFFEFAKTKFYDLRVRAMQLQSPDQRLFNCDTDLICWDKRGVDKRPLMQNTSWDFAVGPPPGSFRTAGEMKSNSLCGMKRGCTVDRPYPLPTPSLVSVPASSKCLASFFIIGARKGGTTSLYLYLAQHPRVKGVFLNEGAKSGETFFFETVRPRSDPQTVRTQYNHLFDIQLKNSGFDAARHLTGESSVGMGSSCQRFVFNRIKWLLNDLQSVAIWKGGYR